MMKSKPRALALTLFFVALFSVVFAPSSRATAPIVTFAGDLTGNMQTQTVQKLQNRTLTITSPTSGQALTYNGSAFVNSTIGTSNITPGSAGTFLVTNATPAVAWSTLDTFEPVHGRITAGGGGSDFKAVMGPLSGFETTNAALHLLANAASPSASNYAVMTSANSTYVNAGPGLPVTLQQGGSGALAYFNSTAAYLNGTDAAAPVLFDWSTSTTPFIRSGTSVTSLTVGTNKAGATLALQADGAANVVTLAGGTQGGIALGANLATIGHMRTPKGFQWMQRNSANSADATVFTDDGANNWVFGDPTYTNTLHLYSSLTMTVRSLSGSAQLWAGGIAGVLDLWGDTIPIGDHSSTNYLLITPAAAAKIQFDGANATSGAISWTTAAAAAGSTTMINGQDAGGTAQNGGTININGGVPTTTGLGGLVQLQSANATMVGVGQYGMALGVTSVAIAVGTNTLSAAQYKTPFIVLTGAIGGGAANIVLPNNPGRWEFDCSQVTGASTIVFKSGSATAASVTTPVGGTQQIITVSTLRGPNTIAINL